MSSNSDLSYVGDAITKISNGTVTLSHIVNGSTLYLESNCNTGVYGSTVRETIEKSVIDCESQKLRSRGKY